MNLLKILILFPVLFMSCKLKNGGVNQKKALVFCHPEIIDSFMDTKHFLNPQFRKYIKNFGGDPSDYKVDTVDIFSGGSYKADAFGSLFINAHSKEYDLVLIPDCGGDWFHFQDGAQKSYPKFYSLITTSLRLLKSGGRVLVGKIIDSGFEANLTAEPQVTKANLGSGDSFFELKNP